MPTIGYNLALTKLERHRQCMDPSGALSEIEMQDATQIKLTANTCALRCASFIVLAAPEEMCVPVPRPVSGLRLKRDFHVGYFPEHISLGDQRRTRFRGGCKRGVARVWECTEPVTQLAENRCLRGSSGTPVYAV